MYAEVVAFKLVPIVLIKNDEDRVVAQTITPEIMIYPGRLPNFDELCHDIENTMFTSEILAGFEHGKRQEA